MNRDDALHATHALRAALGASQDVAGGSFNLNEATLGVFLYFETRGGGRLDERLDAQGRDMLTLVMGFVIDRWLEIGILEQIEGNPSRFRFLERELMPPGSIH